MFSLNSLNAKVLLKNADIRGMEYRVIIQENMDDGDIYMHNFPLEADYVEEAMDFRGCDYHSDCVFILAYSDN